MQGVQPSFPLLMPPRRIYWLTPSPCSHLVDIFAITTQNIPPVASSAVFPAHDARLLRYQDVLAKMSAQRSPITNHLSHDGTLDMSDSWISGGDDAEDGQGQRSVKSEAIGPLLGGFADADSVD